MQTLPDLAVDQHGRLSILATYVQYQCNLPHPLSEERETVAQSGGRGLKRSSSNPDVHADAEVEQIATRGLDRTASMRTGQYTISRNFCYVHNSN